MFDMVLPFVISGLGLGAVYALSGAGILILYRASGVLNFAFGALGALAAYVAWSVMDSKFPEPLAWLAGISVATALAWVYGHWLAPKLAHRESSVRSIATLGFALVILGFTEWYWGEAPRRMVLATDAQFLEFFDVRFNYTRLLALGLVVAMAITVGLLLTRTRMGLKMRALANDRALSGILGVRVQQVETVSWVMCGFLAGIAGILLGNMVRLQATLLTFLVIPALAAVMISQLKSLPLTVCFALMIGVLEGCAILIPGFSAYRGTIPFLLALLALVGYRGKRQA